MLKKIIMLSLSLVVLVGCGSKPTEDIETLQKEVTTERSKYQELSKKKTNLKENIERYKDDYSSDEARGYLIYLDQIERNNKKMHRYVARPFQSDINVIVYSEQKVSKIETMKYVTWDKDHMIISVKDAD